MNKKKNTFRFLMENPKTLRIIDEASNAPIGSTKRAQAKAIINILNRSNQSDGKGSPIPITNTNQRRTVTPKQPTDDGDFLIFPAVPDPFEDGKGSTTPWGVELTPGVFTGPGSKKGDEDQKKFNQWVSTFNPEKLFQERSDLASKRAEESLAKVDTERGDWGDVGNYLKGKVLYPGLNFASQLAKTPWSIIQGGGKNIIDNLSAGAQNIDYSLKHPFSIFKRDSSKTSTSTTPAQVTQDSLQETKPTEGQSLNQDDWMKSKGIEPTPENRANTENAYNEYLKGQEGGVISGTQPTETPQQETIIPSTDGVEETGDKKTDSDGIKSGNLTNEELLYNLVLASAQKGLGRDMTILGIINNPEYAKILPEIAAFKEFDLNKEKAENENLLKEQYKIDEMRNNVLNMSDANYWLSDEANEYVKNRDTFIKTIDDKLDKASAAFLTGDVTDPRLQKSFNQYQTYLNTLKTRQQQSYAEYLNTTTRFASKRLTDMTNAYSNSLQQYESALERMNAASESDYNTRKEKFNEVKAALGGMYDSLSQMEDLSVARQINQYKLLETQLSLEKIMTGGIDSELSLDDQKKIIDIANKTLLVERDFGSGKVAIPDPDGNIVSSIMDKDITTAGLYFNSWVQGLRAYVENARGDDNYDDYIAKYKQQIAPLLTIPQYAPLATGVLSIIGGKSINQNDSTIIDTKYNDLMKHIEGFLLGKKTYMGFGGIYNDQEFKNDLVKSGLSESSAKALVENLKQLPEKDRVGAYETIKEQGAQGIKNYINNYNTISDMSSLLEQFK